MYNLFGQGRERILNAGYWGNIFLGRKANTPHSGFLLNMYGYIYKTTNLINGKIYIGQHKRSCLDRSYLGGGEIFKKALKKYGKKNFSLIVLEECKSREELNEREIYWISFYNSTDLNIGYNIEPGGNQGPVAESTRKKLSKALSGINNPMYGKPNPMQGRHHTEESIKKMSIAMSGENSPNYGRKHSEEWKRKIAEAHRGENMSEDYHRKLSEASKRRWKRYHENHNI